MKNVKFVLVSLLFITIVSCVPSQRINWNNSVEITNSIKVESDQVKKCTKYVGPDYPGNIPGNNVFLKAWKYDAPSITKYQISVCSYYQGDWRFYNRAHDSNGNKLVVTLDDIESGASSCSRYSSSHCEHIGIIVDREYLENRKNIGISFKVEGKGGAQIFTLPPAYIDTFLNLVGT
jgi:hypothetical protein